MIELKNLYKDFGNGFGIKNINITFNKNEITVIIGSSGSGKSTLMRCINNLAIPTSGHVLIDGVKLTNKNSNDLCFKIGMVFQQFHLFPHMDVLNNLIFSPMHVLKLSRKEAIDKADQLLSQFSILNKKNDKITNLSGGQKQRVAIARALMMDPELMLFDEPTSALDPESIKDVIAIMQELKPKMGMVVISHQIKFAKIIADRIIFMDQGMILCDQNSKDFFENPNSHRAKIFLDNVKDIT